MRLFNAELLINECEDPHAFAEGFIETIESIIPEDHIPKLVFRDSNGRICGNYFGCDEQGNFCMFLEVDNIIVKIVDNYTDELRMKRLAMALLEYMEPFGPKNIAFYAAIWNE